ncbi:hypothetical protein BJX66DRAFT_346478 [Aspergillus keveii]|uniref:Six-bladed beta-propeller-like protein n=1 Tax=Aspergillus keveii TaxID=714993 RepID=A0ABR4FUQ7_9EURO
MFLKAFLAVLAFSAPACLARKSPCLIPTTNHTTPSTSTVFQLNQNNTWFENIVVQPNGHLLATRLGVPELWLINPGSNNSAGSGRPLYIFPNASSVLGIAHVERDTCLVIAGNSGPSTSRTPAPLAHPLVRIPEATFLDGIARLNKDTFLIADAVQGEIWRLNITTGEYLTELSNSALLRASSSDTNIGVNGLKVQRDYDAVQTGPTEIVASGLTLDDFYLAPDGLAYLATNSENRLFRVSPEGRVQLVVWGLNELTVAGLTAVARSRDERTLYVTTNGGISSPVSCALVEPAKIVAVSI